MCGFLLRGSPRDRFYPSDCRDRLFLQVVRFLDFLAVGLVVWVDREGDIEGDDGV
jgi:hypothetical protein